MAGEGLQGFMDAISDAGKNTRSDYHLTLGKLILFLRKVHEDTPVVCLDGGSVGSAHSDRGYYSDLAFSPTKEIHTAVEVLVEAEKVLDQTLTGYKGGDFVMDENVPLWVAHYGECGPGIVDIQMQDGKVLLITKEID